MKNQMLIGVAVIIRSQRKREKWFVVKNSNSDTWELPKIVVRKTESSVRSVIRMTGEQGGMRTRVLEEVGRGSSTIVNSGRQISQRLIYYLMLIKGDSGESIGFDSPIWLEYSKAVKKLTSKKEQGILRQAKKIYREWEKKRKKRVLLESKT
jgi:hypothetical protein